MLSVLALAVLPALILICYVYQQDRRHMKDHLRTDAISISSPVDEQ